MIQFIISGTFMKLAKVIKQVISTIKHPCLEGRRLYLVEPVLPDGKPCGEPFVTIDAVRADIGSLVLVNIEGGGSMEVLNAPKSPIQSVIVGIVDKIKMEKTHEKSGTH
jgi:ethanolamine utilization protein EutN